MAEDLKVTAGTKAGKYAELTPQIKALIDGEPDIIANMANVCAALKTALNFFWVGFYLIKEEQLVLGPFQGPVACTRINKGKGVCGVAWLENKTIIVPDVNQFPGHIACSSFSKSEIVIPVYREDGSIAGVLDADSDELNSFDETDEKHLKNILSFLRF